MPVCARVAQVGTSEAALVDLNYNTITHIQARARRVRARASARTHGASAHTRLCSKPCSTATHTQAHTRTRAREGTVAHIR